MSRILQLEALLEEDPESTFALFAIAREYQNGGIWAKARSYYESLLLIDPEYTGAHYHLGKLYETVDEPELAREIYDQGIEMATRLGQAHQLRELREARVLLGN